MKTGNPIDLAQIWPEITYDPFELISACIHKRLLNSNMKAFINATHADPGYAKKVVIEFNDRVRFNLPAFRGWKKIKHLSELPLLEKKQFRQDVNPFRSNDFDDDFVWLKRTSGSSGAPLTVFYSSYFHHGTVLLTIPKIAHRLNLKPGSDNWLYSITLRDKPAEKPFVRFNPTRYAKTNLRMGVNTLHPESIYCTFTELVKVRPFCISSNPSLLEIITRIIPPRLARSLGVKLIISGGGALPEKTRSSLESLFGSKVCSAYGLSETGVIASECKFKRMHFNTSECYPEILSEQTSIPANTGTGEIIITTTLNKAMPMLRYKTGDTGIISGELCACGEPSPILTELTGRVVPVFHLHGGKLFSPTQFRNTFEKFPWLKEFQVIQEQPNRIKVLYESNTDSMVLCKDFPDHFIQHFDDEIVFSFEEHRFEPDSKFQRYKSNVDLL